MGFDLDVFFTEETVVRVTFKDRVTRHHLREASAQDDLGYQRRSSKVRISRPKSAEVVSSDEALEAPVWLYDQICERVEIEVDDAVVEVLDFKKKVPARVKRAVIATYENTVARAMEDEGKN